jgi:hypothetical protein
MECERPWDDFAFGRYPGDQLVEVGCERVQVVNSLQRSRLNCTTTGSWSCDAARLAIDERLTIRQASRMVNPKDRDRAVTRPMSMMYLQAKAFDASSLKLLG